MLIYRSPSPTSPPPTDTDRSSTPQLNVEPPTPIINEPFRDYSDDEDEAESGGAPHEMLDQQQIIMDGKSTSILSSSRSNSSWSIFEQR